ncbi:MAG: Outer membrane protein TolC precursor [candidate division BRC1 bacterium ADurb.BinA364]|nr:MAG: Outer membrane protein TolC precursor [candidate division BRC1 bacterium ADurb.BinA364]
MNNKENGFSLVKWFSASLLCLALGGCQTFVPTPALDQRFPEPTLRSDLSRMVLDPRTEPRIPATIIEDVPSTPTALLPGPHMPLTLKDVLYTTLGNNLDIRISELSRQISRDQIEQAQGIYDVVARLSTEFQHSLGGSRSYSEDTRTRSWSTSRDVALLASLSQLMPSGGVASLAYSINRTGSISQSRRKANGEHTESESKSIRYLRALTAGVRQPLLRGFGPAVTNAPIKIAQAQAVISLEAFRQQVMVELNQALKAYWDLVFAMNNFDVQKLSLSQAQDLLRINTIKYETGMSPQTDVLQAQAQVASREELVIRASQQIQNVMDLLKFSMNIPKDSAQWGIQFIPQQKPGFFETDFDEEEAIAEALVKQPLVRQALLGQEINEINRITAKNNQLPGLDFTATLGGVSPMADESYEMDNYSVGLEFEYPLQNRAARARYRQALARVDQGSISIEQARQRVIQSVRLTLRDIETARERIDITQSAVEYETAKLQAEKTRYDVGISTSFQVLQFQEDFATAQVNYLRAVVDYNKSLLDFELARGTMLETFGVEIEEYGLRAGGPKKP